MQILTSFSQHDTERLFLTYKRNPINYTKIKDKIIGKDLSEHHAQGRKSSWVFFGALSFIILISSSFSVMADHWDSFVALWMIWGGIVILFTIWRISFTRNVSSVYDQNKKFFEQFELIAQGCDSLEDFVQEAGPLKIA
ncbi:MAG: hypothetical protein ACRBFS_06990 [Aureispira sp.]